MKPLKILLASCVYNEGVKLEWTIGRIRQFVHFQKNHSEVQYQILISDDASTDGAPAQVAQAGDVIVLRNEKRLGVGACMRINLAYGLENEYDAIVYIAGNNKDNPSEVPLFTKRIFEDGYDIIQGSRYLPGGKAGNMPFYRQIATRCVHPWLFSLFAGQSMTDTTNGFRMIRLSLLKDPLINLDQRWLDHYELEPYLLFKAIKLGYRVGEAPCTKIYPPKHLSYTKMKPVTGWWSILRPIFLLGLGIKK